MRDDTTMRATLSRRSLLKAGVAAAGAAALPSSLFAAAAPASYKTKRVMLVLFAGGVRSRDTIGTPRTCRT